MNFIAKFRCSGAAVGGRDREISFAFGVQRKNFTAVNTNNKIKKLFHLFIWLFHSFIYFFICLFSVFICLFCVNRIEKIESEVQGVGRALNSKDDKKTAVERAQKVDEVFLFCFFCLLRCLLCFVCAIWFLSDSMRKSNRKSPMKSFEKRKKRRRKSLWNLFSDKKKRTQRSLVSLFSSLFFCFFLSLIALSVGGCRAKTPSDERARAATERGRREGFDFFSRSVFSFSLTARHRRKRWRS